MMGRARIVSGGGLHGNVHKLFAEIASLKNLFQAWEEFVCCKRSRSDVQAFAFDLEENIVALHEDLRQGGYRHGGYSEFFVCDPKRRLIHKASVRDRLLHHAIVRVIEPCFDRRFIFDSWSCRKGKGTHRAVDRFQKLAWRLSRNNTRPVWILKCDIRKYFASVDRAVLYELLSRTVGDFRVLNLLGNILESFKPGIPLGNLTSQLFANVYLNELDHFVKQKLQIANYLRYCDDFILMDLDRLRLEHALVAIGEFLNKKLHLELHPQKVELRCYSQGVDFLGYVCFPYHQILRTKTKKRLLNNACLENLASYNGVLKYCRSEGARRAVTLKLAGIDDSWWFSVI